MTHDQIVARVERIISSLIDDAGIDHAGVSLGDRFTDLGMDDLDLYNAICSAEEVFGVTLHDWTLTINSKVFDLVDAIERKMAETVRLARSMSRPVMRFFSDHGELK